MSAPRRALIEADVDAVAPEAISTPRRAMAGPQEAAAFTRTRTRAGVWRHSLAPLAVMAAFSVVVGMGVAAPQPGTITGIPAEQAVAADLSSGRSLAGSRDQTRLALVSDAAEAQVEAALASATPSAVPAAEASPTPEATAAQKPAVPALGKTVGTRYSTSGGVNVRSEPSTSSASLGSLARGAEVKVTDAKVGEWQQINYSGKAAWVAAKFLADAKPTAAPDVTIPAGGDYSTAACRYGSGIESGLTSRTKQVFRAFCAVFPQITSYGGRRAAESWSYHTRGAAIDAMVSDRELGWTMAKWAAANAGALNIDQVIYAQRIWTKQNPTWRSMADRGSITANHYDHVHISVG